MARPDGEVVRRLNRQAEVFRPRRRRSAVSGHHLGAPYSPSSGVIVPEISVVFPETVLLPRERMLLVPPALF